MATYVIGDIQGCHAEFAALLGKVAFDPARDRLWLTGDLVNRGPASLAVLRAVKALGDRAVVVLGNHDLHLLACRYVPGTRTRSGDTLDDILIAPDCDELLDWLRCRPLIHHDAALKLTMVHAGIPPQWTLSDALACASEVETRLRGAQFADDLARMYGNLPDVWHNDLRGAQRVRFIINGLTRLRYVTRDGRMDLKAKGPPGSQRGGLQPWFAASGRRSLGAHIVFGHWSTLRLSTDEEAAFNVVPLDTGAVWGGALTALRVEDGARFQVPGLHPVALDAE